MTVFGRVLDDQTRCLHYHSPVDIVAIKAIRDYLGAEKCPHCGSAFNAGCKKHYGIYFAISEKNVFCYLT